MYWVQPHGVALKQKVSLLIHCCIWLFCVEEKSVFSHASQHIQFQALHMRRWSNVVRRACTGSGSELLYPNIIPVGNKHFLTCMIVTGGCEVGNHYLQKRPLHRERTPETSIDPASLPHFTCLLNLHAEELIGPGLVLWSQGRDCQRSLTSGLCSGLLQTGSIWIFITIL